MTCKRNKISDDESVAEISMFNSTPPSESNHSEIDLKSKESPKKLTLNNSTSATSPISTPAEKVSDIDQSMIAITPPALPSKAPATRRSLSLRSAQSTADQSQATTSMRYVVF